MVHFAIKDINNEAQLWLYGEWIHQPTLHHRTPKQFPCGSARVVG